MSKLARNVALLACFVLAGCSSALRWSPEEHVVEPGETLYSIAFRYDIDQRDLKAWNRIDNADLIHEGQRLRLTPPSGGSRPAATGQSGAGKSSSAGAGARVPPPSQPIKAVGWQWPTNGIVIGAYGATVKTQSGIQIGGQQGQPIHAASGGQIVYAGDGLAGYGNLLIIKHNNDFLSAYGYNARLLVKEGDSVTVGQKIASMGTGTNKRALLHFEIRQRGQPVNPVRFLPAR